MDWALSLLSQLHWQNHSHIHFPLLYLTNSPTYGSFTLPDSDLDSDSDSDSKPDGYIVLCRSFHIGSDPDLDTCTESFLNRYCTHFKDRYLSQGQISIPIPYTSIGGSESGSEPMWNFCIVQESESKSESESESGNVNKPLNPNSFTSATILMSQKAVAISSTRCPNIFLLTRFPFKSCW